jgi:hypothetical protein
MMPTYKLSPGIVAFPKVNTDTLTPALVAKEPVTPAVDKMDFTQGGALECK